MPKKTNLSRLNDGVGIEAIFRSTKPNDTTLVNCNSTTTDLFRHSYNSRTIFCSTPIRKSAVITVEVSYLRKEQNRIKKARKEAPLPRAGTLSGYWKPRQLRPGLTKGRDDHIFHTFLGILHTHTRNVFNHTRTRRLHHLYVIQ